MYLPISDERFQLQLPTTVISGIQAEEGGRPDPRLVPGWEDAGQGIVLSLHSIVRPTGARLGGNSQWNRCYPRIIGTARGDGTRNSTILSQPGGGRKIIFCFHN